MASNEKNNNAESIEELLRNAAVADILTAAGIPVFMAH